MNKFKFVDSFELGKDFNKDKKFINDLYENEPIPIFEHSLYHILSYLNFRNRLLGIKGKFGLGILILDESNRLIIFTPKVENLLEFSNLINNLKKEFGQTDLKIQNVSEWWLKKFHKTMSNPTIIPRSREEAIYDAELLFRLEGRVFEKIRQSRNRLLNKEILRFEKATNANLQQALDVLSIWQKTQGLKYFKNKFEKERYTLTQLVQLAYMDANLEFYIGYVDNKSVSYCITYQNLSKPDWGTIYEIKGINKKEDGGTHGVSDATYCFCFKLAHERKIKFLNDGELGSEEGTRNHKLGFKPIKFLKSFDVIV